MKLKFETQRAHGLFSSYFDDELYSYAAAYYESRNSYRQIYVVSGVTEVLEAVEASNRNRSLYQPLQRLATEDFYEPNDDARIVNKIKPFFTARIFVFMRQRTNPEDFQFLSASDDRANIQRPEYLQTGQIAYTIDSYAGNLKLVFKAAVDAPIRIGLSAPLVHDKEDWNKHVPYWIDYTSFKINGKVIFNAIQPVWRDKSYRHDMKANAGDEITLEMEWLPHRSDE